MDFFVGLSYLFFMKCLILGNSATTLTSRNISSNTELFKQRLASANRMKFSVSECYKLNGDRGQHLGNAVLDVYMFRNKYAQTVLPQLSFVNPKWTRMDTALTVRNVTYCLSAIENTSPLKFPFFAKVDDYDVITLEYNVTDGIRSEYRTFEFHLPFFPRRNSSDFEHWEVFVYVDITNSHKPIVYWESLPVESHITKFQLNVTCGGVASNIIEYENVFFFEFPYDLLSPQMVCRFYIRPWLPTLSKWGYKSSSPPVFIDRGELLHFWLLLMFFLFAALVFLTYRVYLVIDLKCKHKISGSAMLIYEAKTEEQLRFVTLLAKTLEEDHHVKVYFDHRDIPQTESRDPLRWFVENIPSCEYFIFIQLPAPEDTTCVPPGVYSSQKMATENIFRLFRNSSRIINIELESCPHEETWVCSKLKSRYKYILPKDFCKLVGKESPFTSLLGTRLNKAITDCIQEIKCPKEYQEQKSTFQTESGTETSVINFNQDEEKDTEEDTEEEEGTEIVVSGRRCLLESFHLDGKKSDSESE